MPIPGTTKLHRLEENLAAAEIPLSAEDLREIDEVLAKAPVEGDRFNERGMSLLDRRATRRRDQPELRTRYPVAALRSGQGGRMFPGWMRWRKRRRGSGFEFLIAEASAPSIRNIGTGWPRAAASFSRSYLAALGTQPAGQSAAPLRGLEPRRRAAGDPGDAAAAARRRGSPASGRAAPGFWRKVAGRLRFWASRPLHQSRVLVLGNLLSYGQHGYVRSARLAPTSSGTARPRPSTGCGGPRSSTAAPTSS